MHSYVKIITMLYWRTEKGLNHTSKILIILHSLLEADGFLFEEG
jgi:hypothetical protein